MLGSPFFRKTCCNWLFACALIILANSSGTAAKPAKAKSTRKPSGPITKTRTACFDEDGHSIKCPSKFTPPVIAAIAASIILLLCAIGLAYFLWQRRRRRSQPAASGKYTEIKE
ncbi:hypothetical protein BU17DRAFT_60202 [Hysterangium stoloniferum]|nr:hypothetical protein BU17DRAFT_60202 [Hysterangium stoloniferum]